MNDNSQSAERRIDNVFRVVLGMSLFVAAVVVVWPDQIRVFSDTAHYMSTARMIRDGNGIQSELVYYDEQAISGNIPAPQTVFPPGYPVATAVVSRVTGMSVHRVGRVICLASYAAIAPLIFLLAIGLGLRPGIAATCAAIWWGMLSGWVHVWCYSSDMPFMVLTLLSLLFYLKSAEKMMPLIVAGIAAALAVTVRYTGVFLGITYGVVLLHRYRSELSGLRVGAFLRSAVVLIGPAVLTTVGLFVRNQSYVGKWSGGNNYSVHRTYSDVVKMFVYSIGQVIGFSINDLRSGHANDVLFVLSCVALAGGVVVLCVRHVMSKHIREGQAAEVRYSAILLYVPISLLLLIYLHKTRSSGIASRLMLPTFPLILLGGGLVYQKLSEIGRLFQRLALIVFAMLLASAGIGQAEFIASYRTHARPSAAVSNAMTVEVADGITLRHFLNVHCDSDNSLLSSMPQLTHLFVERPTVGLPIGFYNTEQLPWTVERVHSRVNRFRVRYVLLVVPPDGSKHSAEFFSRVQNGEVPEWLKVVHEEAGALVLCEVIGAAVAGPGD